MSFTNILQKIIAQKQVEVTAAKTAVPVKVLEQTIAQQPAAISLKASIDNAENGIGIISEFKRKSPSKGIINNLADCTDTVTGYAKAGAAGISILTDEQFFMGHIDDIIKARPYVHTPILRKDFTIDEYQVFEARAIGASAILLIAACLTAQQVKDFTRLAHQLNLEVLLELHTEEELDHFYDDIDLVGINNRNLKNFEVDLEHSIKLAEKLPAHKTKIAESGLSKVENVLYLKQQGFNGFLMGEHFMRAENPATALANFVKEIKDKL
ncbi:indole-3-glycerol phosphate synthase TrpC [Polluticaenibacter yanchengensis]|uniref:indole-3-glycerol-phosphate synthase n=1 Tax=Polluticaenibacter yanchengensis TaxID=3014562 RepID=A0ABT4UJG4_9BACT|nr:indole-3-glycerol phosphate synthase TrpC [Chitinophagaceae bacterium LY-5]